MHLTIESFANLAVVDFETYWDKDYTLKKLSTTEYVRDPRFQVIGASVFIPADNVIAWLEAAQLAEFLAIAGAGMTFVGHHAHFDGLILSEHYHYVPEFVIDTLSMARVAFGPYGRYDLDTLSRRFGLPGKLAMPDFRGIRREQMTPQMWAQIGAYAEGDTRNTAGVAANLIPMLTPRELMLIDTFIKMYLQPVLRLDEAMVKQVHQDELDRRAELMEHLGLDSLKSLASAPKCMAAFQALGVEVEMKKGKNDLIPALAKSDPFMQGLLESEDDDVRILAEARLASKSTLNLTRALRFLALGRNGKPMPVYYKPSAAHTHRIGGGDNVNWTNLERTNKKDPKKGRLRKAIMAPPGHKIVVRDSSQIEARFVSWWAQAEKLVSAFAQGRDIYSEQASLYYHRHVDRKKNPEDEGPGNVGKTMVLGGGYGMGGLKAAVEFLKGPMGAPPIQFTEQDIEILGIRHYARDFELDKFKMRRLSEIATRLTKRAMLAHAIVSDYFVSQYRGHNPEIPALWKYMDDVVLPRMAAGEEFAIGPGNLEVFIVSKQRVILPGGSVMHYRNLRQDDRNWIYDTDRGIRHIYGGKFVENLDQAACGVIVQDQMLEVCAAGWPVKLMTYDELGTVVPEEDAQRCLLEMGEIMKRTPDWAPGLPLASDGGIGDRYGEAK